MSELTGDEATLESSFWSIDDVRDASVVRRLLRERFPVAYQTLEQSLEEADPMEVVYPGNPYEYGDVVAEILVLLAPENGVLVGLPRARVELLLRSGLARCFGEPPEPSRFSRAVDAVLDRAARGGIPAG